MLCESTITSRRVSSATRVDDTAHARRTGPQRGVKLRMSSGSMAGCALDDKGWISLAELEGKQKEKGRNVL
jgi:hypothetical protein